MTRKSPAFRALASAAALAFTVIALAPAAAKKKTDALPAAVGSKAPDFTLPASDGADRALASYRDKIVVLEWLNYDCPFSRKHYTSGNMQALQKEYASKGVVWLSIISSAPGKQGNYRPEEISKISKERGAHPAAILLDPKGAVGRLYGAKTTPHMFVIDKGSLVYAGAIDDKPTTDAEDVATARNYVREALDALLAGKPVPTPYTKSYGCSVKY